MLPRDLFDVYPQLSWMLGRVFTETGAPERAIEQFEWAAEGFQEAQDQLTVARVLQDKALALRFSGNLRASLDVLYHLLDLMASIPEIDPVHYGLALCEAGIVSSRLGDLEQGNSFLRRALKQLYLSRVPVTTRLWSTTRWDRI